MKTAPIVPGRLELAPEGLARAPDFDDVYHPASGAYAQAGHVFLAGNGLPGRWAGRERFVLLETGFGLGNNFLATWDAWRRDPRRCERLVFVSVEKHPLRRDDLARAHGASPVPELAAALLAAWPPLTPNLHPLDFDDGRVQLLLGFGDAARLLPQLLASVDAFYLDGFAPAKNAAMWDGELLKRLGRLAAPGATAATWSAARVVRDGLAAAGFEVASAPGSGGKRDITVARYAPRHVPAPPPGGWHAHSGPREALVIGAGLAGCAAAWALARQGWRCRVIDRGPHPAGETSGNPAGLFHGSVHADDGPHARAHRAAALLTARTVAPWIESGALPGAVGGCLRLDARLSHEQAVAMLATQGLPSGQVDWLDRDAAAAASGLAVPSGGWWFGDGGWLAPAAYAAQLLAAAGLEFHGGTPVARLHAAGGLWQALDAEGRVVAAAPVVVLANALDARRLLPPGAATFPLRAVRGQVSVLDATGLPMPQVPVAGAGYVLPARHGRLMFGATSQPDDEDTTLREADHRHNLAQLAGLTGGDAAAWVDRRWTGRVGWRAVTPDRLPLIGAVVDAAALAIAARADRPRFVPRLRDASTGLYLFTGLGSRGIGWAALGGQLLASWITGAPCPVEADLRDALDPARYALRSRGAS
ncbi:MAG TPA: bifunctional tRNA (5-methylaminomethyl-2-thiouridine)(34)-methyltransferase MnmD/FAD-dependent 5-carboxymethylaminomethyl-2-thiouridine(34) oxidoreductase MnmC [Methylibium sp.]|nr:bifunctional tRNA (5-methylaminomethyl-2-thiouridine)(34)-methyltransferase MnmD/FAD-dependent 5-carboxymethylaminomethyl-2-thiouridine(34) oxidoreductase MnmC [Methylibium sp.]